MAINMNGMKRKHILFFGAVAIALLMVSSATAVTVTQTSETKDVLESENNEVYVDPDIYLTVEHLLLLEDALTYLGDSEIALVIRGIITEIDEKGYADGDDIQRIVSELGLSLDITAGLIVGGGPGTAASISLPKLLGLFTTTWVHILKPSPLIWWHADEDDWPDGNIDVQVNNYHWTSEHVGVAFRFRGVLRNNRWFENYFTCSEFEIDGVAQLIFIKRVDTGSSISDSSSQPLRNSQSNPVVNPSPSQQPSSQPTTPASIPSSSSPTSR